MAASGRATVAIRTSASVMEGSVAQSMDKGLPATLPVIQKRISSAARWSININMEVSASSSPVRVAPANTRRTGSLPSPCTRVAAITRAQPASAPSWATRVVSVAVVAPKRMARATAKPLPALTPSKPGSASGLRVMDWSRAPARPSARPVTRAMMVRGSRSSVTTNQASSVPLAISAAMASLADTGPAP